MAQLSVTCVEWKNIFSLEVYFRNAKFHMEGLGGSYGLEKLYHYRMLPEMGPPETTIYEYPRGDRSWRIELDEFFEDISLNRTPACSLNQAGQVLEVVQTIYRNRKSEENQI